MIDVKLENVCQLKVSNHSRVSTALYLIRNNEVIEKIKYNTFETHIFNLRASGNYFVRWFVRSENGETLRGVTGSVKFRGFSGLQEEPTDREMPISLMGINPYTLYAATVLARKFSIRGLVDPSGTQVGSRVQGFDIIRDSDVRGTLVLRYSRNRMRNLSGDTFSTLPGRSDILSNTLELFSIMDLYRISHDLYNSGLVEGAKHIQGFIFSKFNCRIPYQAVIGEGTRIGIGGIGVVIHPDSIIGKNCVIAQNVTLGGRAGGNGTPIVGDNVWISPGAKCLGGSIGSNVVIGANAVVLKEVESNSVVAGVPARVISRDMSKYRGYTGI